MHTKGANALLNIEARANDNQGIAAVWRITKVMANHASEYNLGGCYK